MPINNASRRPRFFILDGFAALPLIITMVYPRYSTLFILAFVSIVILIYESKGVNLPMLMRRVRVSIVGNKRYIRSPWRRH